MTRQEVDDKANNDGGPHRELITDLRKPPHVSWGGFLINAID